MPIGLQTADERVGGRIAREFACESGRLDDDERAGRRRDEAHRHRGYFFAAPSRAVRICAYRSSVSAWTFM